MASTLVSRSCGPGSSPGRRHCIMFWARHFTLTVPLSIGKFNAGGNSVMDWHPIHGGKYSKKYSKSLHATDTGDKRLTYQRL